MCVSATVEEHPPLVVRKQLFVLLHGVSVVCHLVVRFLVGECLTHGPSLELLIAIEIPRFPMEYGSGFQHSSLVGDDRPLSLRKGKSEHVRLGRRACEPFQTSFRDQHRSPMGLHRFGGTEKRSRKRTHKRYLHHMSASFCAVVCKRWTVWPSGSLFCCFSLGVSVEKVKRENRLESNQSIRSNQTLCACRISKAWARRSCVPDWL